LRLLVAVVALIPPLARLRNRLVGETGAREAGTLIRLRNRLVGEAGALIPPLARLRDRLGGEAGARDAAPGELDRLR
jgi:hypothetical protein